MNERQLYLVLNLDLIFFTLGKIWECVCNETHTNNMYAQIKLKNIIQNIILITLLNRLTQWCCVHVEQDELAFLRQSRPVTRGRCH